MDEFMKVLQDLSSKNEFLYAVIAVGVLVILGIVYSMFNSKKVKKQLAEAELSYNTLKSIPLPFKLNKAVALSRVNASVADSVEKSRNEYEIIAEQLKSCSVLLGEIDDLIYIHKTKQAKRQLHELSELLENSSIEVHKLSDALDNILEQENAQRELINKLKNQFRIDKDILHENRASYNLGIDVLEKKVSDIEKMFSTFEEWMFASEFAKAGQQQMEINDSVLELEGLMHEYPSLYEEARISLPKSIDETSYLFAQAKNKGVYLDHLELTRNLETISSTLKEDLSRLANGQVDNILESLLESKTRLEQLREQVNKEDRAYDEMRERVIPLFDEITEQSQKIIDIKALYERVKERFGFENWNENLKAIDEDNLNINKNAAELQEMVTDKCVPATSMLLVLNELAHASDKLNETINSMKKKLDTACADEERAKKQLLKLQLIVNEINVKINKNRLPSISLKYEEDVRNANAMINEITRLLEATPLDVSRLNEKIKEAIDFVYTLFNSVNNLIGMAIMVENTIVFGNRYRSSYPEVDSELTRAELCFRNGQYTKALKIAIQTIEKLHPGSYEKLIRKTQSVA